MTLSQIAHNLGVADVVDAMTKRFAHRAHIVALDSPDPDRVLFGPAVTISYLPVREDLMDEERHTLGPAIYRALGERDPAGAVLVMASNGHPDVSLGGGTKLSRLQSLGMAGVLCDGRLRDYDDLSSYGVGVYCKGETVRAGGDTVRPYLADVPVTVDGVTVVPGDYVFARGSSAVVIPADGVEAVLTMGRQIMQKMDEARSHIAQEDPQDVLRDGSALM